LTKLYLYDIIIPRGEEKCMSIMAFIILADLPKSR
jgi:hypothetical protein